MMDVVVEPFDVPRHKALGVSAALLRPLQRVEVYLALVEQEVAQQRHERHGDDQRAEDEEGDGQAEVLEDLPRDAAGKSQREKDRDGGEGRGGERERDLLRALDAARHAVVALGRPAVDVLEHDDGVIHDHADAHRDAAEAHHVERQVADVHQHEHRKDAHGHGDSDGHGRAPAAQEHPHHDRREDNAEDDTLNGGVHRDVDVLARDVGNGVVNGVVLRSQLLHRRDHRVGGLDLVRARALADLQDNAGRAVHRGDGFAVGGFEGDVRDLAEAHRAAGLEGDNDVRHLLDRGELRVGRDRELLTAVIDLAGGIEQVLRLKDLRDVGGGKAVACGALGVQLDRDLTLHAAGDGDGRHAVDAFERGGDHVLRRLLEGGEIVAEQADDGAWHKLGNVDVQNHGRAAAVGQAERVELLAQLGRRDVHVGVLDVHDLNGRDAVRARRGDGVHARHRHDGGLERARDELLDVLGARAVVVAVDVGCGVFDVRQQRHLELRGVDHAEHGDHNDREERRDLVPDTEFCNIHGVYPSTMRTTSPSERYCWPTVTSCSPAASPLVTSVRPLPVRPVVMSARLAVSPSTT